MPVSVWSTSRWPAPPTAGRLRSRPRPPHVSNAASSSGASQPNAAILATGTHRTGGLRGGECPASRDRLRGGGGTVVDRPSPESSGRSPRGRPSGTPSTATRSSRRLAWRWRPRCRGARSSERHRCNGPARARVSSRNATPRTTVRTRPPSAIPPRPRLRSGRARTTPRRTPVPSPGGALSRRSLPRRRAGALPGGARGRADRLRAHTEAAPAAASGGLPCRIRRCW